MNNFPKITVSKSLKLPSAGPKADIGKCPGVPSAASRQQFHATINDKVVRHPESCHQKAFKTAVEKELNYKP